MPVVTAKTERSAQKEKPVNPTLEYQRAKDREMVRGKFIFHEVPGGSMSFPFHKYKGDPVENFTLVDGEVYTIPLGVAKHLNKNCWYPVHAFAVDENGRATMKIGSKVRRCSFQSLEFVDTEDLTPVGSSGIVTVENVI
jgi:hypothetical protein